MWLVGLAHAMKCVVVDVVVGGVVVDMDVTVTVTVTVTVVVAVVATAAVDVASYGMSWGRYLKRQMLMHLELTCLDLLHSTA